MIEEVLLVWQRRPVLVLVLNDIYVMCDIEKEDRL